MINTPLETGGYGVSLNRREMLRLGAYGAGAAILSSVASSSLAQLLPLAPTASELPWAVENLRFCNWCEQLAQKDLNDCPYCGRRMDPLES